MFRSAALSVWLCLAIVAIGVSLCGCTSTRDYIHNGLKVGPNYCPPPAPIAQHWIDSADARVHEKTEDISRWWTVFNDPVLNEIVEEAYRQNLTLREAGYRILEARATLGIAQGNFFPQSQTANGGYTRGRASQQYFDRWNFGFNMAWELDFWGRFRRAIEAAEDNLEASVASYDDVLCTLLGDVATNYVQIRTDQERIKLLTENVDVQRQVLEVTQRRLKAGTVGDLDVEQTEATLKQTMAAIPLVEIDLRQANIRLCILLGIPPVDLHKRLGNGTIPTTPTDVAVGMPADLLRRRPDVRRAERDAAAQAELIGIAESDFYPGVSILGNLGWQASTFSGLFTPQAFTGSVGPQFQWKVLNYGRLLNNVRFQDARFQELVTTYQQTVLQAAGEVENGIVTFLRAQERTTDLSESVTAGRRAREIALRLYETGEKGFDFNRYAVIEQNLIQQQDQWAQARGLIATGLIQTYRALGGGWEIRCESASHPPLPQSLPQTLPGVQPEELPTLPMLNRETPANDTVTRTTSQSRFVPLAEFVDNGAEVAHHKGSARMGR